MKKVTWSWGWDCNSRRRAWFQNSAHMLFFRTGYKKKDAESLVWYLNSRP